MPKRPLKTFINTACTTRPEDWRWELGAIIILVTRTKRRNYANLDEWLPILGNPDKHTAGNYWDYLETLDFESAEISDSGKESLGFKVQDWKTKTQITFLCVCKDVNKCHRGILAEYLTEKYSEYFYLGSIL